MKKLLKILAIGVGSIILLIIVAIGILTWVVFTPEKITPIVQQQADKHLLCTTKIEQVELTFFSTFPHFALKVNKLLLLNTFDDAPSDTLIGIEQLTASIDFLAYWKRGEYQINELKLTNGDVNVFTDSLGKSNYSIFKTTTETPEPEATTSNAGNSPFVLNILNTDFENINLTYIDKSNRIIMLAHKLSANITGSLNDTIFKGTIDIKNGQFTFDYDNEAYLQNIPAQLQIDTEICLTNYRFTFNTLSGKLNNVSLNLKGFIEYQSQTGNTLIDIDYRLAQSDLCKVLELIPPSFRHYYEGFKMEGKISSEGKLSGMINDTEMPFVNVKARLDDGLLGYTELPLNLKNVLAEITFASDLISDENTQLTIERFDAHTSQSAFSTKGVVTQLFSDIFIDLNSNVDLVLDEFAHLLPAEMGIQISGKAVGNAKTAFTLPQIENFEIDKIKASGALSLSNFYVVYDTIYASTRNTNIEFALPNPVPLSAETGFAYTRITVDSLIATTTNSINAFITNGLFIAEMSNVSDTTSLPHVICSFKTDSLSGNMDSISLALSYPIGKMMLQPRKNHPFDPNIDLVYSNASLFAEVGNQRADIGRLILNGKILNRSDEDDVFSQWLVDGNIDLQQGRINIASLTEQIEIPAIKMDFDNESVNIEKGTVKVGRSDFNLTGKIDQLLSYYKGDSILKGNLNVVSNNADISQLMSMTSGIGYDDSTDEDQITPDSTEASFSGPYLVPKGIDLILNANVQNATYGTDVASNIHGQVRVYNGTLVLDEMKLTTPAARMQLTAMYRTPRKNHLFLGIEYHMLDVEISELLRMIPDIDSIMPMLRSFGGEGEFHLAAETYLDSMYNLKMSTLRGAASIAGQNLVLMDGETFSEIAKTLRFSKKAENRVDSISAEFTIFRDEVDVYPFLVVMDKYSAVVAGRHNLDMSFDYHISLVNSPVPIKLGVDVKGTLDNLKIRPAACQYAELYRPSSRKVVENKQLELRRMIRESLLQQLGE